MTAITIWFNDEIPDNPSLWIAADSRVSSFSNSVLINDAAKIFTLPVVCKYPGEDGFYSKISHYHTYGYCFAGNTLLGQNTFLALLPLLNNLVANKPYVPPMDCVAHFIFNYLSRTFDEYKVIACEKSAVEVALFGWCHADHKPYIFHYFPRKDEKGVYIINYQKLNTYKNFFIYLGDRKDDLKQKIQEAFNGQNIAGRTLSRIPKHIIEDHIQDDNYPSIGGDLQLGIADRYGFKPFSIYKPRAIDNPEDYISYLGYELHEDIKNVGDAFVGLYSMS
jgi:hypothetical protein